jgi:hypothetical protein
MGSFYDTYNEENGETHVTLSGQWKQVRYDWLDM